MKIPTDKNGFIEKIANNKTNQEVLNLNPIHLIEDKLNYYRTLFGKIHDLPDDDFSELKHNISTFFNLKPVRVTTDPPEYLFRISNNNRILGAQGKPLSYLTEISELLAPPPAFCNYGRCNLANEQVLYCGIDEASAFWETKPQKGDTITISRFKLKSGAKITCSVISPEKITNPDLSHDLNKVYYLMDDFFVDAFTLEVDRSRPRDYLFSALLSSDQLFYPVASDGDVEAIIYPSVQRKKKGTNFAIRNDLIFKYYDLVHVETEFILNPYHNPDYEKATRTVDRVIASMATDEFDYGKGKVLYNVVKANDTFTFLNQLHAFGDKQVRTSDSGVPQNIVLDVSPSSKGDTSKLNSVFKKKAGIYKRNEKVDVVYLDGKVISDIKYKKVETDILAGRCRII
ncbi:RES domain-containing protein [Dyadobacter endophyticus]|uniref:RES domain-containing protein n=1 Tax=Dyadobacter endophyticus TaxID=1749036 RepID=UPI003CF06611